MSRKFFVVALCLSGFSGVLFAQNSASITGTVRDSTGAVIGGANVTLTNTATGTAQKVTTIHRAITSSQDCRPASTI